MTGSISGSGSGLPNVSAPSTTASGKGVWHKQGFYEEDASDSYGEVVAARGMDPGQKRLSELILGGSFAALGGLVGGVLMHAHLDGVALSGIAKGTRIGGAAVAGVLALGAIGFGAAKVMQHFDARSNHVPQRLGIEPTDPASQQLLEGSSAPAAFARREFGIDATRTPNNVTDAVLATYDDDHDGALDIGVETDAHGAHPDIARLARAADILGDGTEEQPGTDGIASKAELRNYAALVAGLTVEDVQGVSIRGATPAATAQGYLSDRDMSYFLSGQLPTDYAVRPD